MTRPPTPLDSLAPSASAAPAKFPAGVGAVCVLVATALVVLSQLYAAIPLFGPVAAALGRDATFALSTVYGLCYAVGFILWGPVADHFGRRPVMTVGLAVLVMATAGCGFAGSLPVLGVLRGVQGLAAASFAPVALAYLSEAVAPRFRAMSIGAMSTAFLVAGIVGQVTAQAVASSAGWSWMFLGSAIILAVFLVLVITLVREPARESHPGGLGGQFVAVARLITRPRVLWLCVAHVTVLLSFVAVYTALAAHLAGLGFDAGTLLLVRLAGLPGMFAALASGRLAARLGGPAGLARAGFVLAAIGLILLAVLSQTLVGIGVAMLVFVTGIALAVPAMITLFGQAAAPRRGGGMAINGLVLFLGASLGPILAQTGISFIALLIVLIGLLLVAAISVTFSNRIAIRQSGDAS